MFNLKHFSALVLGLFISLGSSAQDFMMQAWYWDYPKDGCNGYSGNTWAAELNTKVSTLSNAGFTYLWLPPASRASFGSCSNGYDPQDLYDWGEYGLGATGFGTRAEINTLISNLSSSSIESVADVVYNHRDGGSPEDNQAVKDYITNHYNSSKSAFPSDRYRCRLPLGGASSYGSGDYYFKISSKTGGFGGFGYKVYMTTQRLMDEGAAYLGSINESEPNGGGDCGEAFDDIQLNEDMVAVLEGSGCQTDEFHLVISSDDFYASGDNLYIYLNNTGGYSDHRVYGIYYDNGTTGQNANMNDYVYQTYTDFNSMPSGQGGMNFENFSPNSSNTASTSLGGDWDWLWFFYDYDQNSNDTRTKLFDWSKWLWNDVGIRGYRMDAVKHFDPAFIGDLLDDLHDNNMNPGMVVGEYFDSNVGVLNGWVNSVLNSMDSDTKSAIDVRAFDFGMRDALKNACDVFGYDVRNVFNSGMVDGGGLSGFNAVTFINNHDFRDEGQPVQNDPILGYAYILTNNQIGMPCIFYPDYFGDTIPHAPTLNLSADIDALISAHQNYIFGSSSIDQLSRFSTPYTQNFSGGFASTTLFYQMMGGPENEDVLVAINFAGETLNVTHGVNTGSAGLNEGSTLTRIAGSTAATNSMSVSGGNVTFQVPARSYAVWVNDANLPLDLVSFAVRPQNKQAFLEWSTTNEVNVAGFEVQRSMDNNSFEKIAWVPLVEESGTNYQFIDQQTPINRDLVYRLKIIDMDGKFEYSPLRSIKITQSIPQLRLSPNPTKDILNIQYELSNPSNVKMLITDAIGQTIRQLEWNNQEGLQNHRIDINELSSGIYFLQLRSVDGSWSGQKFIKE